MLFQEHLFRQPFWMLVACVLVNRTRWTVAEPVFNRLRALRPTPWHVANEHQDQLEERLRPLGLVKRRSANLRALASTWYFRSRERPFVLDDIALLPGCGRYASDSWAIFVEGRLDVEPTDRALKGYVQRKISASR